MVKFSSKFIFLPILLFALIFANTIQPAESARILSLSYFASTSHKNVYEPLLVELSKRGHQLTIVNPVKSSRRPGQNPNITDIVGIPIDELLASHGMNVFERTEELKASMFSKMMVFINWILKSQESCPRFWRLPQIQEIIKQKFDLIIMNPISNECILGLAYQYKAPTVYITTLPPPYWISGYTDGSPTMPSFVPLFYSETGDKMNFIERFIAFTNHLMLSGFLNYVYYPWVEGLYRKELGDESLPGVNEIMANTSLLLSNSHFSMNLPRATMPNEIEVGGMHCRPSLPLPKDLDDFLSSSAPHGFIYFSFGSMIQANAMPPRFRNIFINVFSKLKQKVLWKWENETIGGIDLPENIKISPWIPQQDVLGHDQIRMFITHGGLLSTEEAVFHGVPLIGFPIYGDQQVNMKQAERAGFALKLDLGSVTEELLMDAIQRILNDPSYRTQINTFSSNFRDRPQKALDLAVHWTEYVLRHSGAPHLRSHARTLNFFAYHSIDVIASLVFSTVLTLYALYKICSKLLKLCFSIRKSSTKLKGKLSKSKKMN